MLTGVVDYRAGNLRSIETALRHIGADFLISDRPEKLKNCEKLIFPGVGEAASAMTYLRESGLEQFIREYASEGKPLFGICLGCQIILSWSEERDTKCLDLIDGKVRLFDSAMGLKVPQIGWNSVKIENPHYLFRGIPDNSAFYFVHSYYPEAGKEFTIATAEYGINFTAAVSSKNICAVQFHPEKSGRHGLRMMENFIRGE